MKKIFIITGEPSGDKLASEIISKLKLQNSNIEYLSVGGEHLNNLGIKSKKNIFPDKEKCINCANKNKIFIKVI